MPANVKPGKGGPFQMAVVVVVMVVVVAKVGAMAVLVSKNRKMKTSILCCNGNLQFYDNVEASRRMKLSHGMTSHSSMGLLPFQGFLQ